MKKDPASEIIEEIKLLPEKDQRFIFKRMKIEKLGSDGRTYKKKRIH
jgi:hypothetical protein